MIYLSIHLFFMCLSRHLLLFIRYLSKVIYLFIYLFFICLSRHLFLFIHCLSIVIYLFINLFFICLCLSRHLFLFIHCLSIVIYSFIHQFFIYGLLVYSVTPMSPKTDSQPQNSFISWRNKRFIVTQDIFFFKIPFCPHPRTITQPCDLQRKKGKKWTHTKKE